VRAAVSLADAVHDADLVIEAIPERLDLKQALFREIEHHAPAGAILATNTSSLSVSSIAEAVAIPGRVLGMHFFNPVPAMKLVELVRGRDTSDTTIAIARAIAEWLGKTPIVVHDSPGFATSRLGVVLGLEAIRMLEQGVASAADIDRAMELGYNHPMGPLRLGDLVGLDVRLAIADHLHATLGGDTYAAPELLRRMVAEGRLGKKTGEGFYRW
jgi:3-hydroxybutyryl-CoA dehydrogenase